MTNVTLNVKVVQVGTSHIGVLNLGGMTVRGRRADTAIMAVRNVLWLVAEASNDDAALGLELEMQGTTIDSALAITDGTAEQ